MSPKSFSSLTGYETINNGRQKLCSLLHQALQSSKSLPSSSVYRKSISDLLNQRIILANDPTIDDSDLPSCFYGSSIGRSMMFEQLVDDVQDEINLIEKMNEIKEL